MKALALLLVAGCSAHPTQKMLQSRLDQSSEKLQQPIRVELLDDGTWLRIDGGKVKKSDAEAPVTVHIDSRVLQNKQNDLSELIAAKKLRVEGDISAFAKSTWLFNITTPGDSPLYKEALDRANAARARLFGAWGFSGETRMIPKDNPMPKWPMREQYAVMPLGKTTIIATDGLASPSIENPEFEVGYGFELWAETDEPLPDPAHSWLMSLVQATARAATQSEFGLHQLQKLGLMSIEVRSAALGDVPAHVVTKAGTVGVLIGATSKRPESVFDDVRYYNVRLLTAAETDALAAKGLPEGRRLATLGTTSRLSP